MKTGEKTTRFYFKISSLTSVKEDHTNMCSSKITMCFMKKTVLKIAVEKSNNSKCYLLRTMEERNEGQRT